MAVGRSRYARTLLPGGYREKLADAATGCALVLIQLVPGFFIRDGISRRNQLGAAAAGYVRAGRREIDRQVAARIAIGGAVVTRSSENGDAQRRGILTR